jgi:sugar phosphate permease
MKSSTEPADEKGDQRTLKLIFVVVFVSNLLTNVDHGSIPAATTVMKEDLKLDNSNLGVLGSLVYVGLAAGKIRHLIF